MSHAENAAMPALFAAIAACILTCNIAVGQTTGAPSSKSTDKSKAAAPAGSTKSDTTSDKAATRAQDHELTASVRKAIAGDKGLSANARNVKVMTINRSVTLRGPVASNAEKERVGALAKNVAGVSEVINNVDVPPPKPPKKKH